MEDGSARSAIDANNRSLAALKCGRGKGEGEHASFRYVTDDQESRRSKNNTKSQKYKSIKTPGVIIDINGNS